MANLLTKPQLTEVSQAHLAAQLYVVYNNKDYRATLATLISLVTKASVGLGNVDNTSDEEKPVSAATRLALQGKANTADAATKAELTALAQQIQGFVSQDALNTAVANLTQLINAKPTTEAMNTAITQALSPISQSLQQHQQTLDAITQSLAGGVVNSNQLDQAVQDLTQLIEQRVQTVSQNFVSNDTYTQGMTNLTQNLTGALDSLSSSTGQSIAVIQQALESMQQTLADVSDALATKLDVEGFLTAEVREKINEAVADAMAEQGAVTTGETQW